MLETWVRSLGWEDILEKGKATHSIPPCLPRSAALLVGRRRMEGLPPRPWAHREGPVGSELLLSTLYTFLPLVWQQRSSLGAPLYRPGNWGAESFRQLTLVTQPLGSKARIGTVCCWLQGLQSEFWSYLPLLTLFSGKDSTRDPWVGKIPWRMKWKPTPVFLPGKSQGQRSLVGCLP